MSKKFIRVFSDESREASVAQSSVTLIAMQFAEEEAGREIIDVRPTESISPDSEGHPWYRYTVLATFEDTEETSGQIDALLFERGTSLVRSGISVAQDVIRDEINELTNVWADPMGSMDIHHKATLDGAIEALEKVLGKMDEIKAEQ